MEPKPIDAAELQAVQIINQTAGPIGLSSDVIARILASHDWHRARVQVTDDDIRAADLGDPDVCVECPRLAAWIAANGMHVVNRSNDTLDSSGGFWVHGIWRRRPRWEPLGEAGSRSRMEDLLFRGSTMAHDHIINQLAMEVGRAPLDVLAEIAATEVSDA